MGSAPSRQTRTIRISAPLSVTSPNTTQRKLPSATPTSETCLPGEILDATTSIHTLNEDDSNEQEPQQVFLASERVDVPNPITFQDLSEHSSTQSRNYKVIRDARMSVGTTDLFDKLAPINPESSNANAAIQTQSHTATLSSKRVDLIATTSLDLAALPSLLPNNPPSTSSSIPNELPIVSNQMLSNSSEQSSSAQETVDPEHLRTLESELRELKCIAEEQRAKYERRILKLRNKLKLARAESSVQIFGLQEEIKALSQPTQQPAEPVSRSAQGSSDALESNQLLHQQIDTKNQLIKDLSIQLLELKHQLLNNTSAPSPRDG
ncbi:hypothetical protein CcCBS67573_g02593 [Chytriomyces confervae]|uniref:Uncharacterized protein n=1 Tax=Chytriomyces confervae TaxID=246404 RepID=A0A507FKI6_9FUNG|nr:hypothetical protein CcCBS67573_g02593 [Chytriomyces confervae]